MKELEQILRRHARQYPKMEPPDAVKLIYQNEFGGGHLIRDEASVRAYLYREYSAVTKNSAQPQYEEIGNGLVRVHLAALVEGEVDALAEEFIRSAALCRGTLPRFLEKLEVLRRLTGEGVFAFDLEALDAYLLEYAGAGYPMVSHSEVYRRAYHPAYRIIRYSPE